MKKLIIFSIICLCLISIVNATPNIIWYDDFTNSSTQSLWTIYGYFPPMMYLDYNLSHSIVYPFITNGNGYETAVRSINLDLINTNFTLLGKITIGNLSLAMDYGGATSIPYLAVSEDLPYDDYSFSLTNFLGIGGRSLDSIDFYWRFQSGSCDACPFIDNDFPPSNTISNSLIESGKTYWTKIFYNANNSAHAWVSDDINFNNIVAEFKLDAVYYPGVGMAKINNVSILNWAGINMDVNWTDILIATGNTNYSILNPVPSIPSPTPTASQDRGTSAGVAAAVSGAGVTGRTGLGYTLVDGTGATFTRGTQSSQSSSNNSVMGIAIIGLAIYALTQMKSKRR